MLEIREKYYLSQIYTSSHSFFACSQNGEGRLLLHSMDSGLLTFLLLSFVFEGLIHALGSCVP